MTFYNPTYTFVAGTIAQSGQVNANFSGIANTVNGNLDHTNLLANAGILNTQCANCDSQFIMGGASGIRPLPTSGTITGEYWHSGNWTQTGAITSNYARIHVSGTMTFNNTFTINTECAGGLAGGSSSTDVVPGSNGAGLGGGQCSTGLNTVGVAGGGGGGFGGRGGNGSNGLTSVAFNNGGSPYSIASSLSGSGGGGASGYNSVTTSNGGNGGGSLYIESTGAIIFNSGAALTAAGGTSLNASQCGGGGSGGGIQIRCLSTVTVNSGASITAPGGAGGSGGAAGGGGGGGIIDISGTTVTNNGTVSAVGGAAGSGGYFGTAGSTGIINLNSFVQNVRSAG